MLPFEENMEGISTPVTFSLPIAKEAITAVRAESIPPLKAQNHFFERILIYIVPGAKHKRLKDLLFTAGYKLPVIIL